LVAAPLAAGARPAGHGFTDANRRDGTCYYVHDDVPGVRMIALDTTSAAGAADGAVGPEQFGWLAERLAEVHSRYRAPDGTEVVTGAEDRLVVLFSHHGLQTLTNERAASRLPDGSLLGAGQVEQLLHRFPNVVLWLHGHTHTNAIRPRPNPAVPGAGFWEVTTCAVMDWPGQARLVELVDPGDGTVRIACTMLDHDSPVVADLRLPGREQLAGLHRELSANVPFAGLESVHAGTTDDRNAVLSVRAPFRLGRE
jgi:hypothetical protein